MGRRIISSRKARGENARYARKGGLFALLYQPHFTEVMVREPAT